MRQTNVDVMEMEENFHKVEQEEIIAYTADRKPLNRQQYIDAIDEGFSQIKEGKFVTHEECMRRLYLKYGGK
ncbi:hypothetical protein FACS189440_01490 [Bacteroidia bacterium]|nr:hypothetical protein FACS189423_08410 [Bacteroidia bacterium]GHT45452.1 hypothetical protein FACS189440_01490 [Bacteroidia bacterium]